MKTYERRITTWNLTIHKCDVGQKGEDIYSTEDLTRYIRENFNPKTEAYAIVHDKDFEKNGTPKTIHTHLVLKTPHNQGKTFTAMKRLFPSSHIEQVVEWQNAILYLTHETLNAKEEGKTLYPREEVVNIFGTDLASYYDKPIVELFDMDLIESYVVDRGFRTILDFGRCFGFGTIAPRWNTIKEIVSAMDKEKKRAERLAQREAEQEVRYCGGFEEAKLEDFIKEK